MTNQPCTTCHHACACREAEFAAYKAVAARMREALDEIAKEKPPVTLDGIFGFCIEVRIHARAATVDYDALQNANATDAQGGL